VRLFVIVAAAAIAAAGCGSESEPPAPSDKTGLPNQEVLEFSLTESVQGSKSWTLFADKAEVFEKKGYSNVRGVKVDFYDPEGKVTSVLTSKRGRVDDARKDLEAFGDVVVRTADGIVLETETLHWDNARGIIWSDDFVTVTKGEEVLTGYGLESDPDLSHVRVKDQVKIRVEEEGAGGGENDSSKASSE
jgi:LPS export ABC transporter protein LptC